MDFNPKHWRVYQQEMAEHQNSAKIPKLVIGTQNEPSGSALPLFVSEPGSKVSTLSAFPDSTSVSTRFPRSYFSLAQRQELELQALIFRYMLAGSTVPPELLQPIEKSFLHSSNSFFLHNPPLQHYSPYQSALFQTGYWGREAMDPEPGRCRRTDGKKWRCSRDVVSGHKYCERHMHRGRNRSRKPVEIPTTTTTSSAATNINGGGEGQGGGGGEGQGGGGGGGGGCLNITSNTTSISNASSISATASGGTQFALSGPFGSIDLLQLNQSSSEPKTENNNLFEPQHGATGDGKSDGHILRHFFDDWPRSLQESDNGGTSMSSSTCLSMSIPENSSSDVSLKLSTGNGDLDLSHHESNSDREHRQLSWAAGWPSNHMGGPLAEALRSSNSNSSPTSVLHQLPRGSVSETSFISA